MIDAILLAVLDAVRGVGYGYSAENCSIMPDGHPTPMSGATFLAVHQDSDDSDMQNALDERYGFSLTLTLRVEGIPIDRVGDRLLAVNLARKTGFNARVQQLKAFLHMNWGVLQDANNYLLALNPEAPVIYGFCEPAMYLSGEVPVLVGGEWFYAEPEASDVGLKAQMRFGRARRLQAIATYV